MERVDLRTRKSFEQAIIDHSLRAGPTLFCRLENQVHAAIEPACLGKITSRAEQHRCVPIVATAVRDTLVNARMRQSAIFMDRQGIHVSPKPNGAIGTPGLNYSDDTGFPNSFMNGDPHGAQTVCHQCSRSSFRECKLRVAMNILTDIPHLGGPRHHCREQRVVHALSASDPALLDGEIRGNL
jgi:hypothetical protein